MGWRRRYIPSLVWWEAKKYLSFGDFSFLIIFIQEFWANCPCARFFVTVVVLMLLKENKRVKRTKWRWCKKENPYYLLQCHNHWRQGKVFRMMMIPYHDYGYGFRYYYYIACALHWQKVENIEGKIYFWILSNFSVNFNQKRFKTNNSFMTDAIKSIQRVKWKAIKKLAFFINLVGGDKGQ